MQTIKCPKCDGTGKLPDQRALGAGMREIREKMGISLRTVAKHMGITAPYLSDLELGRRGWSAERIEQFKEALRK